MSSPNIESIKDVVLSDGVFIAVRLGPGHPVLDVCRAAMRGGLRLIELTLTTPGALETIERLAGDDKCVVGAGTVLTTEDVAAVAGAGGRFVMSPAFDPAVIDAAHHLGLLAVPGAGTATEILMAHRAGADLVKVFPSGALGGPEFLRKVRGPLPDIPLVPTSGPTIATIADYVAAGAAAVGVGAELLSPGFTLRSVQLKAREVRIAMDAARVR